MNKPVFAERSLIALAAGVTAAWQVRASGDLVAFPENYAQGVRYATVHRGNIAAVVLSAALVALRMLPGARATLTQTGVAA